ncbi:MAG TPA: molybdenum cofactor guanylyltransferase [Candidatus Acidoferrum sp.]|nr:molybdenum cofactor guanylyltransferase [Candidatus Acidoferrum sp.]
MPFAGYVMAGGGSTRFGRDKALVHVDGKPMLARMLELVQKATKSVKIVGPLEKYAEFGIETVTDQWPGEGPLGGIITALENAAAGDRLCEWNLIVSCDMPFLTHDWLIYLAERAAKSPAQVVLPHSTSGPEPLCACWRTDAARTLRSGFERGVRKVTDGIALLRAEVLDDKDWKRFDNAGRLFWNMNTFADYEEAQRMLQTGLR